MRAERDYRSLKKALRAIYRFQETVGHSAVVDATDGKRAYPLPDKYFDFDETVLPLIVDESPVERAQPRPRRRRPRSSSQSRPKRSAAPAKDGTSTPADDKAPEDKAAEDKAAEDC